MPGEGWAVQHRLGVPDLVCQTCNTDLVCQTWWAVQHRLGVPGRGRVQVPVFWIPGSLEGSLAQARSSVKLAGRA